jgi:hypothetical protein
MVFGYSAATVENKAFKKEHYGDEIRKKPLP